MKPLSNQVIFIAAAVVLFAGGALASRLYLSPPKYAGPNTQQILVTSQRLHGELPKPPDAEAVAAEARAAVAAAAKRRLFIDRGPRTVRRNDNVEEYTPQEMAPTSVSTPEPEPDATSDPTPEASSPPAAPGSNLALTGISGAGSDREAMVFNLVDRKRESGKEGDSVFGFTIASINDDTVALRQGSTHLTLRLGEKSAAMEAVLAEPVASAGGINTVGFNALAQIGASAFGSGTNPFAGPGGSGGDWRARLAASGIQASFNGGSRDRGRGNRGGFGGGDRGRGRNNNNQRRASTTQSGARRYSDGPNASRRYSTVSSGGSNRNTRSGGFGFGGFGGRGRGGQGNQIQTSATSNPQTARRTGASLTGDSEAMIAPEAISNPQTERRTGGTSGQAFGDSSYGNRGNSNRGGGFGGGGFGNTGRATGGRTTGTRTGTTRR